MKVKPGTGAEFLDVEKPVPKPDEALIKVEATSICGTDKHIYFWDEWAETHIKRFPHIFGHEFAGRIVEVGSQVKNFKEGDYVSAETHIYCGHCYQCLTGKPHLCKNLKILGIHVNGCFAEYLTVPEKNLWRNNPEIPPEVASIQEPLGNAVHTVLSEDVNGKTVAVLGCGPIGLMAIGVAKAFGASKVFATEVSDYRLKLAEKMGADFTLNPLHEDVVKEVLEKTSGDGVDVVLEMSGSPEALKQGLKILTAGGRISLLGFQPRKVELNLTRDLILKGVKVYGVTGRRIFNTWFKGSRLLTSGLLDLKPIITHKFPLKKYRKGMELLNKGEAAKIILIP